MNMNTYIYSFKNGSVVINIYAENQTDAFHYLDGKISNIERQYNIKMPRASAFECVRVIT